MCVVVSNTFNPKSKFQYDTPRSCWLEIKRFTMEEGTTPSFLLTTLLTLFSIMFLPYAPALSQDLIPPLSAHRVPMATLWNRLLKVTLLFTAQQCPPIALKARTGHRGLPAPFPPLQSAPRVPSGLSCASLTLTISCS